MKQIFLIIALTGLLVACGDDQEQPTPLVMTAKEAPEILTYIPADTPLLMTAGLNHEQLPDKYNDVMQSNMEGIVKYMKVMMNQALDKKSRYDTSYKGIMKEMKKAEAMAESGDAEAESITDEADEVIAQAEAAEEQMKQKVKDFVNRWFEDDNFDKVGLKMDETRLAIYAVDLFPVLRIELSSGHQIPAMLADLEAQFDVPFVNSEVNGMQMRELINDKATLMIATQGDTLVITGAPTVIKDQMMEQLIGLNKPQSSLADNPELINQIKAAHDYTVDDIFLLDLQQIADHFIYPAKHNSPLVNFMQIDENMLSAACKTEFSAMFSKAPRLVAGTQKLTDDTIKATMVWEMDSELANDMAQMVGRIPHGNNQAAFAFGMSFDLLNAKNVAAKYVDAMVQEPYSCEHFGMMNQKATELQAQLAQPIPPFVGNLKGFNFSMDELKLNLAAANADNPDFKQVIESLKSQVFFAVDETQALLGMAQMMLPQLQGMDIKTDGSLITLADQVPLISGKDIPFDIKNLYAAISSDTIGISLGHEGGGDLSDKVKTEGQSALLYTSADADGYRDVMEQIFALAEMPNMPAGIKEELEMQKELTLSMLYWDTQIMTVTFSDKGLVTDMDIRY